MRVRKKIPYQEEKCKEPVARGNEVRSGNWKKVDVPEGEGFGMVQDDAGKESREQTIQTVWALQRILDFFPRTLVQVIEGFVLPEGIPVC